MAIYRIALSSLESRGATKPNIIEMGFASDADALTFGANLDSVTGGAGCQAQLTGVDVEVTSDYALPYPAGTENSGRIAFGIAAGARQNVAIKNVVAGGITNAMVAALIAAGWFMVNPDGTVGFAPTYGNQTNFSLLSSV